MNLQSIRLTGVNANYYRSKQDPRGNPSISLFKNHCIKQQRHFTNKQAMLEFVAGYMQAIEQKEYI